MLSAKIGYFRPTGFDPRSISGLAAWWDALDLSTITLNGSTVSQWRDKSGSGYHMSQATAASQPTYFSSVFGSLSAIRHAAATSNLLSTSSVFMDVLADDVNRAVTMFVVLKTQGNAANKTIGETANAAGFGCYHMISNTAFFDAGSETTARVSGAVSQSVVTGGAVFAGRRSGGTVNQWYNGALVAGSRTNATGAIRTGSHSFRVSGTTSGWIAYGEIAIYRRALSDAERASVQSYLGSKWGITVA